MKKMVLFFLFGLWITQSSYARQLSTLEDFLGMHYIESYMNKYSFRRNIYWLKYALKSPYAHPAKAYFFTRTDEEYSKYKIMMKFYIQFLVSLNYMRLAGEFNKFNINWHDRYYKKEILDSFSIAEEYYKKLAEEWEKVIYYHKELEAYRNIELAGAGYIENIYYEIENRKVDYLYISRREINNINIRKKELLGEE